MFWKYLVLTLLPTFAYSRITVRIKPKSDGYSAFIDYTGKVVSVISDKEMKIFGLSNESLKNASEVFMGKRCTNVYVKPPTPWGNVFEKYNWDVVKTTLQPLYGAVKRNSSDSVVLGVQEYVNNFGKNNMTQNVNVTLDILEEIIHNWTKGEDLGLGREIYYNINFGDESLGGTTSMIYSVPWGESLFKSRLVTVGKNSTAIVTIPPGGKVLATVTAIHHTMEIQIIYETHIDGWVFCNYENKFEGHHFYAMELRELQHIMHTSMSKFASETITLKYYTDFKVEISDDSNTQSHTFMYV
ncbi:unnamed protein product [Arctia plantaginis]|uniref:Uncharacterized protein n=1 Tax=Arctia plantaginis TaxID=874455 RepID=A0A8S0ZJJ1_ARCPL|nr:unnamed protein product [Arctia plantaginis]